MPIKKKEFLFLVGENYPFNGHLLYVNGECSFLALLSTIHTKWGIFYIVGTLKEIFTSRMVVLIERVEMIQS